MVGVRDPRPPFEFVGHSEDRIDMGGLVMEAIERAGEPSLVAGIVSS
jgi:hypothetical protein